MKPTPAAAKCTMPCVVMAAAPGGVPMGKPRAGSAVKTPAAIRLTPKRATRIGAHLDAGPGQQRAAQADRGEGDEHRAREQEGRDLHPAEVAVLPAGSTGAS